MEDIFLGYAREDSERAGQLVARLKNEGWSIFWDVRVPTGEEFRDVLERKARNADCVVVVWSHTSVTKRWVRAEAEVGMERGVLVQALIDRVKPPFGFAEQQASN